MGSLLIFLTLLSPAAAASPSPPASSSSSCLQQSCGGVTVSYPFGLSDRSDCPLFSPFFNLTCDRSSNQLFLHHVHTPLDTGLVVTNITNTSLIIDISPLNVSLPPLSPFPSNSSCSTEAFMSSSLRLPEFPGPFFISDNNMFGSFGCTNGILLTTEVLPLSSSSPAPSSSPLSLPVPPSPDLQVGSPAEAPAPTPNSGDEDGASDYDYDDVAVDGCAVVCPGGVANASKCGNGRDCCVTSLAPNSALRYAFYEVLQSPFAKNISCQGATNYATLFHPTYSELDMGIYRLKLMWALPSDLVYHNQSQQLPLSSGYACSNNASFSVVHGVPGYLCSCNPGYKGDGYLNGSSCNEINECVDPDYPNNCVSTSTCENWPPGNYTCRCKHWFREGDGRKNGSGCQFSHRLRLAIQISAAFLLLGLMMGIFFCLAIWWRKRTKDYYFKQHGGMELQTILRSRPGGDTRIFKEEELKAATSNYADHMKLGAGGFGTVFKGVLEDGTVVAIKRPNMRKGGEGDREQFLNEMDILVRLNHRNIVRLLGCCLETVVPLLVYEFLSNGNLQENLEGNSGTAVMGWQERLEVARQTAEALAYLHAYASPPILHRDVKSANVLLGDKFDAKVADFGLSQLVLDGVGEVGTALQGTVGYLDPEYLQTFELTDKSDVYSLGVVLVELITGLKPFDSHNREPRFASLALYFIHHMREGTLDELVDARLHHNLSNHDTYSSIRAVAALAHRCLNLQGSRRPSMSQVVDKLHHVVQTLKCGHDRDEDEFAPLLSKKSAEMEHMEASAVMPDDSHSQYFGTQSGSIQDVLINGPTLPR